jgi:PII-like signaling protein
MTSGKDLTRGLAETAREKRKEVAMVWKCILGVGAEDEAV